MFARTSAPVDALEVDELELRPVRHVHRRDPVLRLGLQAEHLQDRRARLEHHVHRAREAELLVLTHRLARVLDGQPDTNAADVGRTWRRRLAGRRLHQLDEVAIGILHHDAARLAAEGHVNRRPAGRHDRRAHRLQPREDRIQLPHDQNERERAGVLNAALDRLALGLFHLDDLDAGPHRRRTADRPSKLRVREPEHVSQRRILIRVRRRALNVEAEPVAIERDGLVEIADDGAEEVAHADDEACSAP